MTDPAYQNALEGARQVGKIVHRALAIPLSPPLSAVLQRLGEEEKSALIVGGAVRDALLGIPAKDLDIEVYNTSYDDLAASLSRFGRVDLVGKSFGVIKLTVGGECFDFSIPRRDSKTRGVGHKGLRAAFDPRMTPQDAAARRDFTWNALLYDPGRQELHDYFGGQRDLEQGILRHTGPAFAEDPLRVLRGMQFAARFAPHLAPETAALCRSLAEEITARWTNVPRDNLAAWCADPAYEDGPKGPVPPPDADPPTLPPHDALLWVLPRERLAEEWMKLATKGRRPSRLFSYLEETGWIVFFPEIRALVGLPQEPEWHPEGTVDVHTGYVMDAAVLIADRDGLNEDDRAVLVLAALTHDFGKPATTARTERVDPRTGEPTLRWTSYGHEEAGVAPAAAFLTRSGIKTELVRRILPLVENHLRHLDFVPDRSPHPRVVRRLAGRLKDPAARYNSSIAELVRLMEADHSGRPAPGEPIVLHMPEGAGNLLRMAEECGVNRAELKPLILGRHVQLYGLAAGPEFGRITREALEAQIEGALTAENAREWMDDYMLRTRNLRRMQDWPNNEGA